jgi:Flp pilus assembly protein TadG
MGPGSPGRRQRRRLVSLARRDDGALTLSYLIVVPVFMLVVMLIIQTALWYLATQAALAAARQGADAARLPGAAPGAGPQAALSFARNSASGYLLGPQASAAGSTGTTVQITVCGHVATFVPGLDVSVSQAVQAPVERFATPEDPAGGAGGAPAPGGVTSPGAAVAPAPCPGGG